MCNPYRLDARDWTIKFVQNSELLQPRQHDGQLRTLSRSVRVDPPQHRLRPTAIGASALGPAEFTKGYFENATKRADKLRAKGKEFDFNELLKMEPDGGTTNVRNTSSAHWKR